MIGFQTPEQWKSMLHYKKNAVFKLTKEIFFRYWLGVVQLGAAAGNKAKSLHIILSLRDAYLLDGSQKWGK